MTNRGKLRYRIGMWGDTVIAQDKVTSTVHAYRKRPIADGTHQLDVAGSIKTKNGRVVSVSKPAEASNYSLREERGRIILSRKLDRSWRVNLSASTHSRHRRMPATGTLYAIVKLRGGRLSLLGGGGMFRLDSIPAPRTGDPDDFNFGDDFMP